jgi:hypothetical protein
MGPGEFARASSPRPKIWSWRLCRLLHQLGELLAGIKHAGLHGGGRDAENLRGVVNRLLVIIDEVDNLAVFARARSTSPWCFFSSATSALSAVSAPVVSMVSSSAA